MTDDQGIPLSPSRFVFSSQEHSSEHFCVQETPYKKARRNIGGLLPAFQMLLKKSQFGGGVQNETENVTPSKKIRGVSPSKQSVSRSLFDNNVPSRLALSTLQTYGPKSLEIQPKQFSVAQSKATATVKPKPSSSSKRQRRSSSPTQRKKTKFGKINSGVGHGIRKPKPQSKSVSSLLSTSSSTPDQPSPLNRKLQEIKNKIKKEKIQPAGDESEQLRTSGEGSWTKDDPWAAEEDHLHMQVESIVEHLDTACDITSEQLFVVQSDEQLRMIAQLIQIAKSNDDKEIICASSPSTSECELTELAPLKKDKIKEVEDLIDQLLGADDELIQINNLESEINNSEITLPKSDIKSKIIEADTETLLFTDSLNKDSNNKDIDNIPTKENYQETPKIKDKFVDQEIKDNNFDSPCLTGNDQSPCIGLDPPSQTSQNKIIEIQKLIEKLNQSSHIDPDDSDPFADYDTDECSDISQKNILLYLNSEEVKELNYLTQENNTVTSVTPDKTKIASLNSSDKSDDVSVLNLNAVDVKTASTLLPRDNKQQLTELNTGKVPVQVNLNSETEIGKVNPVSNTCSPTLADICKSSSLNLESDSATVHILETENSKGKDCDSNSVPTVLLQLTNTEDYGKHISANNESQSLNTTNSDDSNSYFTAGEGTPEVTNKSEIKQTEQKSLSSKVFPVFMKGSSTQMKKDLPSPKQKPAHCRRVLPIQEKDGKEQLLLDAGQKRFGTEMCEVCKFLYDPDVRKDVEAHRTHHNRFNTQLKHLGWRNERVVADFKKKGRILMVKPGDSNDWWRRLSAVLEVVNHDLGFIEEINLAKTKSKVFLYILDKKIVGCIVAEEICCANRMLPGPEALCSEKTFPALCGVMRVWTSKMYRRKGFASKLMNAVRENFLSNRNLELSEIAFSSPTADGRSFATRYLGSPTFLVC